MLYILSSLLLLAGVTAATPWSPELRREELMAALGTGGYTIILRHARTDRSSTETPGSIPKERSEQRNLTDEGIRDAKLMGTVLRKYGIPVGEVVSSPMYRTVETAEFAVGKPTTTMALRVFPSTDEQAAVVAAPAKPGTNRLIVTHHFVIEKHVPGINPGDIGESEAAVVRPTGDGKVELVGKITLSDWEALAGVQGNAPAKAGVSGYGAQLVADQATNIAGIPNTPAGRLAAAYITAFNSGSAARMRIFLESSMAVDRSRSTEERLKTYERIFQTFGPLALTAPMSSKDDEVTLGMHSKQGAIRVTLKISDAQPGRVSSVSFASLNGGHH